ncbi:hypothetical protein FBU59_001054 [Linderina macrospora]|uniref:Uncharacterized protein n=1 Tax=Linderina macrospora TaxID=4868 RepID=A0ACC1JF16_9FUNG|nr:hypothetical protein FBU59_001054 [Linderina macrospora]
MEAALCGTRALALSFAYYDGDIANEKLENACEMAVEVIEKLWVGDAWNRAPAKVFNVNVPLVDSVECPVFVTKMARNANFASLYKLAGDVDFADGVNPVTGLPTKKNRAAVDDTGDGTRVFVFSAPYGCDPEPEEGTDSWAVQCHAISVTPLRPEFQNVASSDMEKIRRILI